MSEFYVRFRGPAESELRDVECVVGLRGHDYRRKWDQSIVCGKIVAGKCIRQSDFYRSLLPKKPSPVCPPHQHLLPIVLFIMTHLNEWVGMSSPHGRRWTQAHQSPRLYLSYLSSTCPFLFPPRPLATAHTTSTVRQGHMEDSRRAARTVSIQISKYRVYEQDFPPQY